MPTILDFLAVPDEQRDIVWLQSAVQLAIEVELATIPPYLTAMWSIKDQDHQVAGELDQIIRQEMLHLGLACNLLTSLTPAAGLPKAFPRIASSDVVLKYPAHLPGNVHPSLTVPLERVSRPLVKRVFMEIEKPEFEPIAIREDGQPYPTIGAFYDGISDAILQLGPHNFEDFHQHTATQVALTPITSQLDALRAISLIKKQGEGTAVGPYFASLHPDQHIAHFYRFAQIYHEHRLQIENWKVVYNGAPLHFPKAREIYPMAPVPMGGYNIPEARTFDDAFTGMLHELEDAWTLDGATAQQALVDAITLMNSLADLATNLMTKYIPGTRKTYGPAFLLVS